MCFSKNVAVKFFLVHVFFLLVAPIVAQTTIVGVAKNATQAGRQVTLDFYLENLGDEDLSDIELTDDLDAVFGAGNYSVIAGPTLIDDPGTITVNPGFNGSSDIFLLNLPSTLAFMETAQIQILVELSAFVDMGMGVGIYTNQVTANAIDSGENFTTDLSDFGTDPDPNGNGDPTDAGEDDPTIMDFLEIPRLGVAKNATLNGNQVTLDFYLENLGNRSMNNLSLPDDLDAVFVSATTLCSVAHSDRRSRYDYRERELRRQRRFGVNFFGQFSNG